MTNRVAEINAVHCTDGKQGNFEIKLHHAFHDDAPGTGTTALLGIVPCQRAAVADKALPLPEELITGLMMHG